ncbi:guanylate kinase [Pyramidobacter piscolens W5455]|uniref:Guanylate kinase n=2 Tax=Pyramidobacter piscolens TaxID=638849 RepID=A0ABM9ZYG8_9BACT|nr:guanylate kinase [Pyramidobacter piscolens]EFB91971.1 guanylate kinase [Pyramidobacter piscolens W5455]BDF78759.1 guanylate kinase [Pyramidobacter piscolens]
MTKNRKGTLFVLSGPSGAGKGTIRARVFEALDGLSYSVSCTTRAPREGERDGVDYRFITPEDFAARIAAGDFLEWADVHRHRYGTLKSDVEKVLNEGKDMFLEIDVQGALQVKKKMPEAVTLFVVPPSIEVLEERLRGRRSEGEAELRLRLRNAVEEMKQRDLYDFVVVNDSLDEAVKRVCRFVEQRRQAL